MKYIVVKIVIKLESYDIEYGKAFDDAADAIEQAAKLNELARKNDWADLVQFAVLPCEVTPKGAE